MNKKSGSVALIVISVAVIVLLAVAAGVFLLKPSTSSSPSGNTGQLSNTTLKGDINRDGKVDEQDAELIKKASPCNHADPCWSKVVGKTKDGDNPIYTSDLDLNHDDNVNELDISAMSSE